ncbi:TIGR03546 family protein [candidate division KSB1 bacterium]|nr:TIGR03546 family protein [candidate division KSB1 bacterium]
MFPLQILSQIIKAFRAGETPTQIAAGFGVGFLIGLMPFWTLQGVLLFLVLLFVNINMAAGSLAMLVAGFVAFLLDPLFHNLGYAVLTLPALQGTWEALYNLPVAPLSRFNNTVVMGSFLGGLVLFAPVYVGMKKLVVSYRSGLEERIKKWKVVQSLRGSKIVEWYVKIRDLGSMS